MTPIAHIAAGQTGVTPPTVLTPSVRTQTEGYTISQVNPYSILMAEIFTSLSALNHSEILGCTNLFYVFKY